MVAFLCLRDDSFLKTKSFSFNYFFSFFSQSIFSQSGFPPHLYSHFKPGHLGTREHISELELKRR